MAEPSSPPDLSADEKAIHAKRLVDFKRLNFTETEADLLAASDARVEDAESLLGRGCSHQLAVAILH